MRWVGCWLLLFLICFQSDVTFAVQRCPRGPVDKLQSLFSANPSADSFEQKQKATDFIVNKSDLKEECAIMKSHPFIKKLPLLNFPPVKWFMERLRENPTATIHLLEASEVVSKSLIRSALPRMIQAWNEQRHELGLLQSGNNSTEIHSATPLATTTTATTPTTPSSFLDISTLGDSLAAQQTASVVAHRQHSFAMSLTALGDDPMFEDENPSLISCYTLYMMAYVSGWLAAIEFFGRASIAIFAKNRGEDFSHTLQMSLVYGLLFVATQVVYLAVVVVYSKSQMPLCHRGRLSATVFFLTVGVSVLGVLDPRVPPTLVPEILAWKQENPSPNKPASHSTKVLAFDDLRYAETKFSDFPVIGPFMGYVWLATQKPLARIGLAMCAFEIILVLVVCGLEGENVRAQFFVSP